MLKNSNSQLLVNDSYYVGVWSAPEAEQAYILDMDVMEKLAQNSVEAVDFVPHKMFDQLFLKTESKRKQRRYQKNWKFKYKHKHSLRSRKITFKETKKREWA